MILKYAIRSTVNQEQKRSRNESTTNKRQKYQTKINNVIAFANAKIKIYYEFKHKSFLFKFENKSYFRLNKAYICSKHHQKLSQRRCEFFLIRRRIER